MSHVVLAASLADNHNGSAFRMEQPTKLAMDKSKKRARSQSPAAAASASVSCAQMSGVERTRRDKKAPRTAKCNIDDAVMQAAESSMHTSMHSHASATCGSAAGPVSLPSYTSAGVAEPEAVIGAGCTMLLALSYDRDCRFALLNSHLNLADLAHLVATCRTWRNWIAHPSTQLLQSARRTRVVSPHGLRMLAQCEWVRPMMIQIRVNMRPSVMAPQSAATVSLAGADASQTQPIEVAATTALVPSAHHAPSTDPVTLASVVADLARFPRLSRVGLQLASDDADREDWRAAFEKLPNLQQIELLMAGPAMGQAVLPPPPPQQFQFPPPMQMAAPAGAAAGAEAQAQAALQHAAAVADHAAHLAHAQAAALSPPVGSAIAALFQELHHLQRLESLSVHNLRELPSSLDFSRLPLLPKLRSLSIVLQPVSVLAPQANGAGTGSVLVHQRLFRCNPAQAEALGRCRWLQQLRCGVWAPPPSAPPAFAFGAAPDEAASLASRTLGALASGKKRALSEWREQREEAVRKLASNKGPSSLPVPSALPLQSLCLSGSVITAATWRYLSRLTHLTELAPAAWAADLDDAPHGADSSERSGWALLAKFRHLRALRIAPLVGEEYGPNPLRASSLLPPLLRGCSGLQSLHLHGIDLSRAQLQQLIRGLPDLRYLSLRSLRLEDAAPLAEAKRLQALSLHFCVLGGQNAAGVHPAAAQSSTSAGAGDDAVATSTSLLDFRRSLPSMPALAQLLLHDRVRITSAAAAPLNAALFARMPRLQTKHFHQNLLAEPVQPSHNGEEAAGVAMAD